MEIKVNGSLQLIEGEVNITRLLEINEVQSPSMVAVQLNGRFVDQGSYTAIHLQPDDEVEFLYFMGGGRG